MTDTTDERTVFALNSAQNEGIMREVERLVASPEWAAAQVQAVAARAEIRKALTPDPETLSQPMTI